MHPLDRVRDALAAHGCPVDARGNARCPHHEDKRPSLHVTMGETAVVMHCHVGCATPDIVADIGLAMSDLFLEGVAPVSHGGDTQATYDYRDEDGRLLYQVVRRPGKKFLQRRPPTGLEVPVGDEWIWNLKGVTPVLYRLPEILDAISLGDTIYVAEGEKDVEALVAAGAQATCNSGGAGKWRPEFGRILSNAERVVIVADDDEPGHAHARTIAASLNGTQHKIMVAAAGKDAADHLAAGFGLDSFVLKPDGGATSAEAAPPEQQAVTQDKPTPKARRRNGRSFKREAVVWLPGFEGFIPMGMLAMLAGLPGLGKSMFGCYLAAEASRRGQLVVIAAAEDSIEHTLIPRLVANHADLDHIDFIDYVDEHGDGALHLPDHDHLLRSALAQRPPTLLILDPIGSFMGRAVDAWKATDVRAALGPLKIIAEEHMMAMLVIAHLNKGKGGYLDRVADSAAFGQVIRSGMLWGRDPDDPEKEAGDRRILVSGKLNVGMRPSAQVFRIVPTFIPSETGEPPDIATARLEYLEDSERQTDDLLVQREIKGPPSPQVEEAMHHLRDLLSSGPKSRTAVMLAAKEWDISRQTVDRAFDRLNAVSKVEGFPAKAYWSLP